MAGREKPKPEVADRIRKTLDALLSDMHLFKVNALCACYHEPGVATAANRGKARAQLYPLARQIRQYWEALCNEHHGDLGLTGRESLGPLGDSLHEWLENGLKAQHAGIKAEVRIGTRLGPVEKQVTCPEPDWQVHSTEHDRLTRYLRVLRHAPRGGDVEEVAATPEDPIPLTWLRGQVRQNKVKGDASKLALWLKRRKVPVFKVAGKNHAERADLKRVFKATSRVRTLIEEYTDDAK